MQINLKNIGSKMKESIVRNESDENQDMICLSQQSRYQAQRSTK